jgi:hypothetical protein
MPGVDTNCGSWQEQEQIEPDQGFGGVAALGGGIVASSVGG